MKELANKRLGKLAPLSDQLTRLSVSIERQAIAALPSPKKTASQYIKESIQVGVSLRIAYVSSQEILMSVPFSPRTAQLEFAIHGYLLDVQSILYDEARLLIPRHLDSHNMAVRLFLGETIEGLEEGKITDVLEVALRKNTFRHHSSSISYIRIARDKFETLNQAQSDLTRAYRQNCHWVSDR